MCRSLLSLDMHNEVRKERYNIKYFVGCEDMLAKYIKETCNMADFSDNEILTALGTVPAGGYKEISSILV
jgi:hypothetical protein